jgi:hypothetical protein
MPRYKLPPVKAGNSDQGAVASVREDYSYPDEWARQLTIPVNSEILAALEVGGEVSITLKGSLQELSNNQSSTDQGRTSLTVSVSEVEAYMVKEDVMSEKEEMLAGFGAKRGRFGGPRNN